MLGVPAWQSITSLREVKLMACNSRSSENQQRFPSGLAIHLPGLKNVNKPDVLAFTNLWICSDCGFKELVISGSLLRQLGNDGAGPRLQTSSLQEMTEGGMTS
jgi:hypothetical protein